MAQQLGSNYYNSPYKFNGKELDEETGLYYYGARYYDPKVSIWLSVDPLTELTPDWTPYRFCFNNPLKYVDPDGKTEGESPIFDDNTGEFLGVDNKGFLRGEVLFMSKEKYESLTSQAGGKKIEHSVAVENSTSIADLPETEKGFKLFTKAVDYISKKLYALFYHENSIEQNLFGNSVQVYSKRLGIKTEKAGDLGGDIGLSVCVLNNLDNPQKSIHQITFGFDHRKKYLNTAPNIFSLFEHEYQFHGVMGLRQKIGEYNIHGEVYKRQANTFNFKNYVTGDYKRLVENRNKYYNDK
ncbi:RHS repeat-associated core domain-containing protein [Flavobacterium sp.]|uniref:RHS repeat domain-containing protein n=1 Tax=Flavobacterium sp. TaxID=239 RepID=UPI00333E9293